MKIVINKCYGGFGISREAMDMYKQLGGESEYDGDIERDDPLLIKIVEEMKEKANNDYSKLSIIEIPSCVIWEIEEYDGIEWVAECHRTWS